jgi:hypothetical protein
MSKKLRVLAGLSTVALSASLLLGGATPAAAHTCTVSGEVVTLRPYNEGDTHVQICHGTGSDKNPYVIINPDVSGACGHYQEHLVDRPAGSNQSPDVFPDAFLAAAQAGLCD